MTGFLLDTSILSELAPGRRGLPREWADRFATLDGHVCISAISVMEIEEGVGKLIHGNALARSRALAAWLSEVVDDFGSNVLPIDTGLARKIGELSAYARSVGRHPGLADVAIGATAQAHDLLLLTRNVKHFAPLGITVADPFLELPA